MAAPGFPVQFVSLEVDEGFFFQRDAVQVARSVGLPVQGRQILQRGLLLVAQLVEAVRDPVPPEGLSGGIGQALRLLRDAPEWVSREFDHRRIVTAFFARLAALWLGADGVALRPDQLAVGVVVVVFLVLAFVAAVGLALAQAAGGVVLVTSCPISQALHLRAYPRIIFFFFRLSVYGIWITPRIHG